MTTTKKKTTTRKKKAAKAKKPAAKPVEAKPELEPTPEPAPEPEKPKVKASAPGGPEGDPRVVGPEPLPEYKTDGPAGEFGVPSEVQIFKDGEPGLRLKSLVNRPLDVTLTHEDYCAKIGRCVCAERDVSREEQIERGSAAQRRVIKRVRLPKSIRIPARGLSEPLHKAVTMCPDVEPKLFNRPQKLKIMPV